MSDITTTALATQEDAPAPRLKISYVPVESAMGIMDTARFEHIGRVASVMAAAQLMPMTLTHVQTGKDGSGNPTYEPLPMDTVRARAYLIANQADLWHADPMAVAQCTSMVHGKMMYEGKLVHGIISARLGVDLKYDFGVYNPRTRNIDAMPANGLANDDQSLGVRVSGTLPGETEPRWIAGSVAMWHKGAKSPWGTPNAWPRQLRYMGAREWCRAFKPSLLLGILTDDEVDEYDLGRQVGAVAPAAPQMLHAGFEDQRPAQVIEGPKPARRKKAAEPTPAERTEELQRTQSGGAGAPLDGDDIPATGGARPTGTAGAQGAASEPATSETATGASDDGQGEPSSQQGSSEQQDDGQEESEIDRINREAREAKSTQDVVEMGHPEPGEVYHLDGDVWDEKGRRQTYQNGERFSSAGRGAGLKVYGDHAPEAEVGDTIGGGEDGTADEEAFPAEFKEYIEAIESAPGFADVKRAMQKFYTTDLFKGFSPEQQNKVRADTWGALIDRKMPLPDHASDVSAFRLWIEHEEDADAIVGTLRALEQDEGFTAKEPSFKQAIRQAVANRASVLQQGG